jgi:hypothetical protein
MESAFDIVFRIALTIGFIYFCANFSEITELVQGHIKRLFHKNEYELICSPFIEEGKDNILGKDHIIKDQKRNGVIEIEYNELLNNPIKILFEDILELIEIKEGYMTILRNNHIKDTIQMSSFYITQTPITIELWKILMNDRERSSYGTRIEWDDYLRLQNRLKELAKVDFSFPSSIQWDYATNICDSVKMPSYGNNSYLSYISVGLFDFHKGRWCTPNNADLPYQVLCSMGNGHEELFLFLATNNNYSTINYTKEEKERISALISEISYVHIINKPKLNRMK